MKIDGLTKDYNAEIRALSAKKQKEANAKEAIRRVDESTKSPLQQRIDKDKEEIKELEALAGDDEEAKEKVRRYAEQKQQEWGEEASKNHNSSATGDGPAKALQAANRDLDAARKTYENARRRLEMADRHVLAMEEAARAIIGKRLPALAIARAMEAALRALETIVPTAHSGRKLDREGTGSLGPEWLADLYAAVGRAAPGIPWREFLDMPLAAATHLAAAAHRANGGKTERPMDWSVALEKLAGQG